MTADTIATILKKTASLLREVDSSFDIGRFLAIEQQLVPASDITVTDVSGGTVALSAHITGVAVADADAVAVDVEPALVQLGYAVTIRPAEKTTVMAKCRTECGPSDCGQCPDGRFCTSDEDCFSTCHAAACGPNPASTASFAASLVVILAVTLAMLM
jgi:hypothetical protein